MKKVCLFLSLLLMCKFASSAQSSESTLCISGKLVDSRTGNPVPYASITLIETSISNVSNNEGEFTLKIPEGYALGEVNISRIGYAARKLRVSDFGSKRRTVEMIPINLTIEAAVIKSNEAYDLLRRAINRVECNYPQVQMGWTTFYREIIRKGSTRYLSFNEAIIYINKSAYGSVWSDKAGIYKSRGSHNYTLMDSLLVNYQGGVISSLKIDIAKHPFAGITLDEALDYYDFKMGQSKMMDDRMFYVVEFDQKEKLKDQLYFRGKVYIESESLAIGRLEMNMNVEGKPNATTIFIKHKPADRNMEIESASYTVNYKQIGDVWHYDYAQIDIRIAEKKKHSLFKNHYQIVSELAVTDRSLKEKPITDDNRIRFTDVLSKKVSDFTDEDFWGNYNTIEPDKSIEVIIKKIISQLKNSAGE